MHSTHSILIFSLPLSHPYTFVSHHSISYLFFVWFGRTRDRFGTETSEPNHLLFLSADLSCPVLSLSLLCAWNGLFLLMVCCCSLRLPIKFGSRVVLARCVCSNPPPPVSLRLSPLFVVLLITQFSLVSVVPFVRCFSPFTKTRLLRLQAAARGTARKRDR